jgi:general secretion pathway protein F
VTAYRYRALNPGGKLVRGVLEADSERQVRSPAAQPEAAARGGGPRPAERGRERLPAPAPPADAGQAGDLALLTRQLATLVQSNLPLADCLQAAAEQNRRPRLKAMLLQVRSRVSEGHTLAYALAEFPQVFNEMYRAMVAAGEHAGFLGPVLEQLADYAEQRQHTSAEAAHGDDLPVHPARCGRGGDRRADGVRGAGADRHLCPEQPRAAAPDARPDRHQRFLSRPMRCGCCGRWCSPSIAFRRLLRAPARRRRWHALLLRVPGLAGLLMAMDTARFASTLSILMASGVPLLEALRIAGAGADQPRAARGERAGGGAGAGGQQPEPRPGSDTPHFPPMMVHMVASGESSGSLETMLERSAANQERELEMTLGTVRWDSSSR